MTNDRISKLTNSNQHLSWDDYFLGILEAVSKRATCNRGRAACVFVRDNILLSTGYVGSPRGFDDCDHVGHLIEQTKHVNKIDPTDHCVRTVHAEQNAISNACRLGISLKDSTCYVSFTPCRVCAMMLVQIGVRRVVCNNHYATGSIGDDILRRANIEIVYKSSKTQEYK